MISPSIYNIYTVKKNCHYNTVIRYWSWMEVDERMGHGDCISTCMDMAKMVGVCIACYL